MSSGEFSANRSRRARRIRPQVDSYDQRFSDDPFMVARGIKGSIDTLHELHDQALGASSYAEAAHYGRRIDAMQALLSRLTADLNTSVRSANREKLLSEARAAILEPIADEQEDLPIEPESLLEDPPSPVAVEAPALLNEDGEATATSSRIVTEPPEPIGIDRPDNSPAHKELAPVADVLVEELEMAELVEIPDEAMIIISSFNNQPGSEPIINQQTSLLTDSGVFFNPSAEAFSSEALKPKSDGANEQIDDPTSSTVIDPDGADNRAVEGLVVSSEAGRQGQDVSEEYDGTPEIAEADTGSREVMAPKTPNIMSLEPGDADEKGKRDKPETGRQDEPGSKTVTGLKTEESEDHQGDRQEIPPALGELALDGVVSVALPEDLTINPSP